jgi:hypothetical protein
MFRPTTPPRTSDMHLLLTQGVSEAIEEPQVGLREGATQLELALDAAFGSVDRSEIAIGRVGSALTIAWMRCLSCSLNE